MLILVKRLNLFCLFKVTNKKNSVNMENLNFKSLFTLALCSLFSLSILAQSTDDLYYAPSYNDYSADEVADYETASAVVKEDNANYAVSDSRFDNDFNYQSRLRRFCNPVRGLSYYAPAYTNSYYYNNSPYAWSNNIYTQPYYSQRWWSPVNTYNIYTFGNNGYNYNRNYTSTYTSFGSTIYNNRNYNNPYNGSVYNYNNSGGFFNPAPFDGCTTTNYISNNSIDTYNASRTTRSTSTRSNSNVRSVSSTPSASQSNSANKAVRSAVPSTTKRDRSATRSTTTNNANKSTNVRTERKSVVEKNNSPKKERKSGIRKAFRNLGDAVGGSSKSNTNKSYRSTSGSKSYNSGSSKGTSRSSGTSRGGRR